MADQVEDQKKQAMESLIIEKNKLQQEIQIMKQQKQQYDENKEFYDRLIAFHDKIQDLKSLKTQLIVKIQDINAINEQLRLKIGQVEESIKNKDDQEQKLRDLLQEIERIKAEVRQK